MELRAACVWGGSTRGLPEAANRSGEAPALRNRVGWLAPSSGSPATLRQGCLQALAVGATPSSARAPPRLSRTGLHRCQRPSRSEGLVEVRHREAGQPDSLLEARDQPGPQTDRCTGAGNGGPVAVDMAAVAVIVGQAAHVRDEPAP